MSAARPIAALRRCADTSSRQPPGANRADVSIRFAGRENGLADEGRDWVAAAVTNLPNLTSTELNAWERCTQAHVNLDEMIDLGRLCVVVRLEELREDVHASAHRRRLPATQ
jgi:hypothetical protein